MAAVIQALLICSIIIWMYDIAYIPSLNLFLCEFGDSMWLCVCSRCSPLTAAVLFKDHVQQINAASEWGRPAADTMQTIQGILQ